MAAPACNFCSGFVEGCSCLGGQHCFFVKKGIPAKMANEAFSANFTLLLQEVYGNSIDKFRFHTQFLCDLSSRAATSAPASGAQVNNPVQATTAWGEFKNLFSGGCFGTGGSTGGSTAQPDVNLNELMTST